MHKLKFFLRQVIPPFLLSIYSISKDCKFYTGFKKWSDVENLSTGYDSEVIFEKVLQSTIAVKNGGAAFERDSVLFKKEEYSWSLLFALFFIAAKNKGELRVLDFGGALGSTFLQNKKFLERLPVLSWNIIEQEKFVQYGRELYKNGEINFFNNFNEFLKEKQPSCILLSSVLQYISKPYELIDEIISIGFDYIIIDRTPFSLGEEMLTLQVVPNNIYPAKYPCWFFDEKSFLKKFEKKYDLVTEFKALDKARIPSVYKGFILVKKNG